MIDIHSKGAYPSDMLSNFYPHDFVIDGIKCASMEGFLQSLKFPNVNEQIEICQLWGVEAKEKGLEQNWQDSQTVHWQGQPYNRHDTDYQTLITRAFNALSKNKAFLKALRDSSGCSLDHTIGVNEPQKTILTRLEFLSQLERLRGNLAGAPKPG